MRDKRVGVLLIVTFAGLCAERSPGQEDGVTAVLPSDRASVEGNAASSRPFGQRSSMRIQSAYDANTMSTPTPVRITGVQLRPNANAGQQSAVQYDFRLEVSTCRRSTSNMSRRYDRNTGFDKTVVFDGTLNMPAFQALQGPNDFVLKIPFREKFDWNPSSGPLLLDFQYRGANTNSLSPFDSQTSRSEAATHSVFSTGNATSTQASADLNGAPVIKLDLGCSLTPRAFANRFGQSNLPWNSTTGVRMQSTYDRSTFSFTGRHRITRLAWRTVARQSFPGGVQYGIEVSLSTGRPNLSRSMSPTFSNNHGSDRKVVFDGIFEPDASPRSTSSQSRFAQFLELDEHFDYNPRLGSLVIDIKLRSINRLSRRAFHAAVAPNSGFKTLVGSTTAISGTLQDHALLMCVTAVPVPVMPEFADTVAGANATSFPWNASTAQRSMNIYTGFALGQREPLQITHISWRPQENTGRLGPVTYRARIELSTGSRTPGNLSRTFATNHGPDRILVFDDEMSVPFRGSTGPVGEFLLTAKLRRPFRWDPRQGPLVVDVQKPAGVVSGGNTQPFDAASSTTLGRVVHRSDDRANVADFGPQGTALVIQLGGTSCARVVNYGAGCAGQNGVPQAITRDLPNIPSENFAYQMLNGASNSVAALMLATTSANVALDPLGFTGCTQLTTLNLALIPAPTASNGSASIPSPVPNNPAFNGVQLFAQWLCLDTTAPGGLTLSDGMRLVLCR